MKDKLKRHIAATKTCQAVRAAIAAKVGEADWQLVHKHLVRWMRLAGKNRYDIPK